MSQETNFAQKRCPHCGAQFALSQLYHSPELRLMGMAFAGKSIDCAYYYFQHASEACGTTFAVPAEAFIGFIDELIPADKLTGRAECEQRCINIADLQSCSQNCYFAAFRRLLLRMLAAKDQGRPAGRVSVSQFTT